MGRSCFLTVFLVSFFLALVFSQGFGRKVMLTSAEQQASSSAELEENNPVQSRSMMASLTDYDEPRANVNPRTGYIFSPPPPPHH